MGRLLLHQLKHGQGASQQGQLSGGYASGHGQGGAKRGQDPPGRAAFLGDPRDGDPRGPATTASMAGHPEAGKASVAPHRAGQLSGKPDPRLPASLQPAPHGTGATTHLSHLLTPVVKVILSLTEESLQPTPTVSGATRPVGPQAHPGHTGPALVSGRGAHPPPPRQTQTQPRSHELTGRLLRDPCRCPPRGHGPLGVTQTHRQCVWGRPFSGPNASCPQLG